MLKYCLQNDFAEPQYVEINTSCQERRFDSMHRIINHFNVRPSRLTSRVIIANSTLTDIPHIKTPMMLSSGPSMRTRPTNSRIRPVYRIGPDSVFNSPVLFFTATEPSNFGPPRNWTLAHWSAATARPVCNAKKPFLLAGDSTI